MNDVLRIDAPAAKKELEFLKNAKVGDTRKSVFLSALGCSLEWKCVWVSKKKWVWEASMNGHTMMKVEIAETDTDLNMTEKEF